MPRGTGWSIGQATAGRDIMVVSGIGAAGIALIVALAIGTTAVSTRPMIDTDLVIAMAEAQGYVPPDAARALEERVARTQTDLDALREAYPDLSGEIDKAIGAFNASDLEGARAAFTKIDALIDARREELNLEQARSKHAQVTLFYPFEFSKGEPLLCDAAQLAAVDPKYWIDCGVARIAIGHLEGALAAFKNAEQVARTELEPQDIAIALTGENGGGKVGHGSGGLTSLRAAQ